MPRAGTNHDRAPLREGVDLTVDAHAHRSGHNLVDLHGDPVVVMVLDCLLGEQSDLEVRHHDDRHLVTLVRVPGGVVGVALGLLVQLGDEDLAGAASLMVAAVERRIGHDGLRRDPQERDIHFGLLLLAFQWAASIDILALPRPRHPNDLRFGIRYEVYLYHKMGFLSSKKPIFLCFSFIFFDF